MNNNEPPAPDNWEDRLQQALKKLPDRQAPASLMPGVMEQIHARAARPWYRGSWWELPVGARVAGTLGLAIVLAEMVLLGGRIWKADLGPAVGRWMEVAGTVFSSLAGGLSSVFPMGPGSFRLGLSLAGLLVLALYLSCIGIGSLVYRVVRK